MKRLETSPDFLASLCVGLATLAVFAPALRYQFVGWDDYGYLLVNKSHWGFGPAELKWIFTSLSGAHYYPLTWITFALDRKFWDLAPMGCHLTNIVLHAANAAVFYFVSRELLRLASPHLDDRPEDLRLAAAFSALFFSLHPLRVESVAWVTERSNVLSGLFTLLTFLFYLRRSTAAAFAAYAASLLSKSIGMTLPLVLLILDFYPLRRLPAGPRRWFTGEDRSVWLEKIPFALAAAAIAAVTYPLQVQSHTLWSLAQVGPGYRAAQALYGLIFYLRKTLLPTHLSPIYVMPPHFDPLAAPYVLSALGVAALSALAVAFRKSRPWGLAAWAAYAVVLLPVSGIVKIGPQIAADRYTYLPCLGWAALAGGVLAQGLSRTRLRGMVLAGGGLILALLSAQTLRQLPVWRDTESFWGSMAAEDPGNFVALNALGNLRLGQGRTREAETLFRAALRANPDYGAAHNNLGNVLTNAGRFDEAVTQYQEAFRCDPGHPATHYNWGLALLREGKTKEAAGHFREELKINPDHEDSRRRLEEILKPAPGTTD